MSWLGVTGIQCSRPLQDQSVFSRGSAFIGTNTLTVFPRVSTAVFENGCIRGINGIAGRWICATGFHSRRRLRFQRYAEGRG